MLCIGVLAGYIFSVRQQVHLRQEYVLARSQLGRVAVVFPCLGQADACLSRCVGVLDLILERSVFSLVRADRRAVVCYSRLVNRVCDRLAALGLRQVCPCICPFVAFVQRYGISVCCSVCFQRYAYACRSLAVLVVIVAPLLRYLHFRSFHIVRECCGCFCGDLFSCRYGHFMLAVQRDVYVARCRFLHGVCARQQIRNCDFLVCLSVCDRDRQIADIYALGVLCYFFFALPDLERVCAVWQRLVGFCHCFIVYRYRLRDFKASYLLYIIIRDNNFCSIPIIKSNWISVVFFASYCNIVTINLDVSILISSSFNNRVSSYWQVFKFLNSSISLNGYCAFYIHKLTTIIQVFISI